MGAAELLARSDLQPEPRELVELLQRSASTQLGLIGNVLDLARIEADRLELEHLPYAPAGLLAELDRGPVPGGLPEQGSRVAHRGEYRPAASVLGDSLRLRQILVNLVGNAIKFTERGGVVIRAQRAGDPGSRASASKSPTPASASRPNWRRSSSRLSARRMRRLPAASAAPT